MKIGICGMGRAGKDHAASYLAEVTGLRYTAGTSWWARHLVYDFFVAQGWQPASPEQLWNERHRNRELWAKIISDYNTADPVALYRDCLAEQNFLTGIRFAHEYSACRAANLCDIWLFIDRPGCVDPTCQITPEMCDATIHNHGTLKEFHGKLTRLASILRLPPAQTARRSPDLAQVSE